MSLTFTEKKRVKMGNAYGVAADITFDSSYPTNGESLTAAQFGLTDLALMLCETASGYMFQYDYTNSKLKAFYPRAAISDTLAVTTPALSHDTGATPVTASAASMPDHAAGESCTVSGVAGVAAGEGAEVGNGVDLSSVTVRVMAFGV